MLFSCLFYAVAGAFCGQKARRPSPLQIKTAAITIDIQQFSCGKKALVEFGFQGEGAVMGGCNAGVAEITVEMETVLGTQVFKESLKLIGSTFAVISFGINLCYPGKGKSYPFATT